MLHFVIWGLLIARLLIPVTLESSVHLFVILTEINSETVQEVQTSESGTEPVLNTNAYNSRQAPPQANTGGRIAIASSVSAGNTLGHLSLYHHASKTLIAGDALSVENGELVSFSAQYCLDNEQYLKSLKKLAAFQIGAVACYHGGLYRGKPNQHIAKLAGEI